MARSTFFWRGFVEQDRFAFELTRQFVAIGAFHVRVHALQRESGAPVVVEERRFPLGAVVTFGAGRDVSTRELLAMGIVVALLALFGSGFEVDVHHVGFEIRRFVAIDARGGAMRTQQRETCLRMIELAQFPPRLRGMAGLAPARSSRSLRLLHALIELATVWIGVATGATQIGPVINRRGRLEVGRLLVAIGTRHRDVLTGQKKARFFVARQRKRGRPIRFNRVATFTRVEIWRCCELAGVRVLVAVGAVLKLHLEHRVGTARDVAFLASHSGVSTLQRICSSGMIRDRKS